MAVTVPPHLVRQVGLLIGRLHPLGVHHPGTREGSSGWCLGCVPQVECLTWIGAMHVFVIIDLTILGEVHHTRTRRQRGFRAGLGLGSI